MATIQLKIEGTYGNISAKTFLANLKNELAILSNLNFALTKSDTNCLEWYVKEMRMGSLMVGLESQCPAGSNDRSLEVVHLFINGMHDIEVNGVTPQFYSPDTLNYAKKIAQSINNEEVDAIIFSSPGIGSVNITSNSITNIDKLLPTQYTSIGSVEGIVELISIHNNPRFVVYHSRTKKAITCNFKANEYLEKVKSVLGRKVNVAGNIHYNAKGEPVSVDIANIRIIRDEKDLPSISDLMGIDPDFTNGIETVEYLRRFRIG